MDIVSKLTTDTRKTKEAADQIKRLLMEAMGKRLRVTDKDRETARHAERQKDNR